MIPTHKPTLVQAPNPREVDGAELPNLPEGAGAEFPNLRVAGGEWEPVGEEARA